MRLELFQKQKNMDIDTGTDSWLFCILVTRSHGLFAVCVSKLVRHTSGLPVWGGSEELLHGGDPLRLPGEVRAREHALHMLGDTAGAHNTCPAPAVACRVPAVLNPTGSHRLRRLVPQTRRLLASFACTPGLGLKSCSY